MIIPINQSLTFDLKGDKKILLLIKKNFKTFMKVIKNL
jgi:hypothetical protein